MSVREQLAWLMWCFNQGYKTPEDRAILCNWMGDDPRVVPMHPDDVADQAAFLTMADEILAQLREEAT